MPIVRASFVLRFLLINSVLIGFMQTADAESPRRKIKVDGTLVVGLDQGWSDADAEWFYNVSQGSQLIPFEWLKALKTSDGSELLVNSFPSFGYVAREKSPDNEHGLPVGFVKDNGNGRDWLGMNCAACHTNVIENGDKFYLIDGAPTLADVEGLLRSLAAALKATNDNGPRFDSFAQVVLAGDDSPDNRKELAADLVAALEQREGYLERNMPRTPQDRFGFGRVDAIGAIMNEVTDRFLDEPANQQICNAPVSYPHLWDTPYHDKVQWNGSAPNTILDLGNLARNVGEVLGVFGYIEIPKKAPRAGYSSTVQVNNLREIERKLKLLKSPMWPPEFGNDKADVIARGKGHFQRLCAECHTLNFDRSDEHRHIVAKMDNVGTDVLMAKNFRTRKAQTGRLKGTGINFVPIIGAKFGETADGDTILTHAIIGTIIGGWKEAPPDQLRELQKREPTVKAADIVDKYKARPLNGIWATAPYLHNGSVPTLRDLLKPAAERPATFSVGSRKFNSKDVGFDISQSEHTSKFDTSLPGNSNRGHEYGTGTSKEEHGDGQPKLSDLQIDELIAFIRTI